MSQFFGTHQNRLDAKGRVSVPSAFRSALRDGMDDDAPTTLVLRPSHKHPCIEGWPNKEFDALTQSFARLNKFSDEYDDLSMAIFAQAYKVEADREGRIVLPADLVSHAGLTNQVSFLGAGTTFQIWEPDAARRRLKEASTGVRLRDSGLPPAGAA